MTRIGNRKAQIIILLVLVCLVGTMSIAYAILSTTLNINGTAQVQDASWNVHFDNIQVNPYSVEINPVITDNNKVSFSADLTTPGEFYKFTVDIVNEGSIDAMIDSIIKTPELTTDEKKYLRYEVEYVDGTSINDSQLLKNGETKTISILFSYRNDIPTSDLPTTESDFDLEIALVYVQADSSGTEISGDEKIVKVVSGDLNTIGSEICIDTECFYLIKNNGKNVTMLAKYNLSAGNSVTWIDWNFETTQEINPLVSATGKQDKNMIGANWNSLTWTGTVEFSSSNYWSNITKHPTYIYNENSSLYQHIENYKNYLKSYDIEITKARLISYEELRELGCSKTEWTCKNSPYDWTYGVSYWTGSSAHGSGVWDVYSYGDFDYDRIYSNNTDFGIRPVIEIPVSEF